MTEKQRKNYSPEEKVSILRRHLLEKVRFRIFVMSTGFIPRSFIVG